MSTIRKGSYVTVGTLPFQPRYRTIEGNAGRDIQCGLHAVYPNKDVDPDPVESGYGASEREALSDATGSLVRKMAAGEY